jgi:biopolymer transport protein ExbD
LQKDLVAAAQNNPQVKVAIRADKQSPFGEVIKVIDAAKVAGVGSIDAVTEKPAAQ